jgi:hypothetical protein
MTSRVKENIPNTDLRRRIGIYFHDVLGTNFCLLYLKSSSVGAGYKLSMGTPLEQLQRWPMYGSVREVNLFNLHLEIIHSMKLKSRSARSPTTQPDNEMRWVPTIYYGRLKQILVCERPTNKVFGAFSGQTRLLAVLSSRCTAGKNVAKIFATTGVLSGVQIYAPFSRIVRLGRVP